MRTVLSVATLEGMVDAATGREPLCVRAEAAAIEADGATKVRPFALTADQLPDWAELDGVRSRGQQVLQALRVHAALGQIIDHLGTTPAGKVAPLFMKLAAGDPELIPWEAMCDGKGQFLALDQRWPIGRISDSLTRADRGAAVMRLPVKLLAVISAYGIKGQDAEWRALALAVQEARQAGLPIEVKVLSGEPSVRAAVEASIAGGMAGVTLGGVDTLATRVVQDISGWDPNVLHFFCHGHAGTTPVDQRLELATAADFAGEAGEGSVNLRRSQLEGMLTTLGNPWLLMLNCCSGGAASTDVRSLASAIVNAGFPAAVAMIEPVERRDLHEFARAFYRSLFADLRRAQAELAAKAAVTPGARVDFEFATAMHDGRNAICDLHGGDAANQREWVLPVLYVRSVAPLQFESAPANADKTAEYQVRARILAQWLQQVHGSLDEAGRLQVLQSGLADVPTALWPDLDGRLPGQAPAMSDAVLHANAWCGSAAQGPLGEESLVWGVRPGVPGPPQMAGAEPIDLARWQDPRVGWGLVVPDSDAPGPDKARGLDLPEPLQKLLQQRGNAPVLRWRADLPEGRLRRYDASGKAADLRLGGARGTGPLAVPRYLAIAASPAQIPWRAQYRLQTEAFVGRIDLPGLALARYVDALMSDWSGTAGKSRSTPLVWAADHGHPDITRLMRKTIAERLAQALANDPEREFDMAQGLLVDDHATGAALLQALGERNPAFVMTSSHGATPTGNAAALRAVLGLPVDQAHGVLDLPSLSAWNPAGTIWYAHACCSAGADARSSFSGIFDPASTLAVTLDAIAAAGACQAPLPAALLGAVQPARAFIGHVEPTFDWTLRDPGTGQVTTQALIDSFYDRLHVRGGMPVGLALHAHFGAVAGLLLDHGDAVQAVNDLVPGAAEQARRAKLMATDRLAMVILGDPTVTLAASG